MTANQRLLAKLDGLARWTGMSRLRLKPHRHRNLRWLPLLPLVIGTGAMAITFFDPAPVGIISQGMIMPLCIVIANGMQFFGPLKTGKNLDEREMNLWRDSFLFSFWIIGSIEIIGIPIFLGFAVLHAWPSLLIVMRLLSSFMYLFFLFCLLPTLYASWSAPQATDGES